MLFRETQELIPHFASSSVMTLFSILKTQRLYLFPIGLPDAPLDIQVESGPQDGTLLITWLPVTITTSGMSNGALVTGYSVYIDGQKVKELNSPTGKLRSL